MIAETRHQMILDILHKQRSASVQELAEQLHISESTIRRDLIVLDRPGKADEGIWRSHGNGHGVVI